MRLPRPFYRLPVRIDAERLRAEVASLPKTAWVSHPNQIAGNSAVRLISVGGGENDDVNGPMAPTTHLQSMPYVRQIMAAFGVVWSRARLLRLAAGATVPEHADINYHWYNRVRLHIPVVTLPQVRFYCGEESVHMAAGEAWIFDNWRLHRVENFSPDERIHLVADTSGSSSFWRLVAAGEQKGQAPTDISYVPQKAATPLTERVALAPVMAPAEVDLLTLDLRGELVPRDGCVDGPARLARFVAMLDSLCRDWRQLHALHGEAPSGWEEFAKLRDSVRNVSRELAEGLMIRTNRVDAHSVLEGRVLRALLSLPVDRASHAAVPPVRAARSTPALRAPIFIIAAPRSGSSLLYETMAASSQLCSLGGEAHWLVESIPALKPGTAGVDSNRLTDAHVTAEVVERIQAQIMARLQDHAGQPLAEPGTRPLLEKTPKNALRVPFFDRLFPDARFVFLWREPRANIASIIEAWRSGGWTTYDPLEGFDRPWSLLLPPGWRALNGKPLEEIAAWQWAQTNRIALDDLAKLALPRWTTVRYEDLVRDPRNVVARLFGFLDLPPDPELAGRLSAALPNSRHTLTAPHADKWRAHEAAIERVLPSVEAVLRRLQRLP